MHNTGSISPHRSDGAARPQANSPFDPAAHGWMKDGERGFVTHIGQVWQRSAGASEEVGFLAEAKHLNRNGAVHGGMLTALFDHAVGSACFRAVGQDARLATIQITSQFMREAMPGNFVTCGIEVLRVTPSLIFLRGECRVDGDAIMAGEAIVKRRRRERA